MEDTKKYNVNDPEAVEIRRKIEYLTSFNEELKLNDAISIDEVRKFEAEHNITLPDDYVWFITNVGNGGKWDVSSGYQFYPLEETYFSFEEPFSPKRDQEKFSLDVLSSGCSYSFGIILKGEHYAEISYNGDRRAAYYPMAVHGFKEFYLKWLNEAYAGYDDYAFERRRYGSIEEHLEQYRAQHEPQLLSDIFSKVNKSCATKSFILDVYDTFRRETQNECKVKLARILIKAGYEDVFSVLNETFSPENFEAVIFELYFSIGYFSKQLGEEVIMDNAEIYYPLLVKAMKYYETSKKREYLKYCLKMTVMNPKFDEKDIMSFLTSDDPKNIEYMAKHVHEKKILDRIGKYIEKAKADLSSSEM